MKKTQSDVERFHLYEEYRKTATNGWEPLRYATKEGWVLGAWTWRVSRDRDHCEIGLLLCEDHQMYVTGSALNWSLRCIFTQAYYQTGRMEIEFLGSKNAKHTLKSGFEPVIPEKITILAKQLGVNLAHCPRITHDEAKQLYLQITGFSRKLIDAFTATGIDPVWPCVLVQRDIWSEAQIEYIFEHAIDPNRIFQGGVAPILRLSYLQDLIVLRLVLMAERLKAFLELSSSKGQCEVKLKWLSSNTVGLVADRSFELIDLSGDKFSFPEKTKVRILLLPRNCNDFRLYSEMDFEASKFVQLICVTRDYRTSQLPSTIGAIPVVAVYDTLDDIDQDAGLRLSQTESSNSELAQRHE